MTTPETVTNIPALTRRESSYTVQQRKEEREARERWHGFVLFLAICGFVALVLALAPVFGVDLDDLNYNSNDYARACSRYFEASAVAAMLNVAEKVEWPKGHRLAPKPEPPTLLEAAEVVCGAYKNFQDPVLQVYLNDLKAAIEREKEAGK